MERISWTEHIMNEEVSRCVSEKRRLIITIRERRAEWIGHVLCHDSLLKRYYKR